MIILDSSKNFLRIFFQGASLCTGVMLYEYSPRFVARCNTNNSKGTMFTVSLELQVDSNWKGIPVDTQKKTML